MSVEYNIWHLLAPDVIQGRHVFFAVDNVDFAEDIPDGKRSLHATSMAIYQRCQPEDEVSKLELTGPALRCSMKELPSTVTALLDCPKPPSPVSFSLKEDSHHQMPASQMLPGFWDEPWLDLRRE
ncbi:hypothetical protein EOD39_19919 [Acipenser ruthenus]|uniref:Uncharacterized protein n=1 Tax=Acipenser ruthenus TaxID=7906 RepID=A0A444UWX5_ACIRT|nr:hypothetical protein EOD39_19919 [Acipenser ruthenus]